MRITSNALSGARIVVIGAGAVGATTAYRLAQAGARVTVVERRHAGAGTSGASLAWTNSFHKPPLDYHRLNARSMREHAALESEVDGRWLHLDGGITWIADGDAGATATMQRRVRQLNEWGYRVERTTPDVIMREIEPDLRIDRERVTEVFVAPGEGWLEAVPMAHRLLHAAHARHGLEQVQAAAVGLRPSGRGIDGVVTADGAVIPADVVVNAAGPWAAEVAYLAGVSLALRRQPGVTVSTTPAPVCLRSVVHSPDCNLRPDGGGRLLLHRFDLDPEVGADTIVTTDGTLAHRALVAARRLVPALEGVLPEAARVGVRPMPIDGLPIVGFEPDVPGLYELVTHSGITLSAILACFVTEELAGADVPELAPYRPARFIAGAADVAAR